MQRYRRSDFLMCLTTDILVNVLGLPLSENKVEILGMFRQANKRGNLDAETSFKKIFCGVVEMLLIVAR